MAIDIGRGRTRVFRPRRGGQDIDDEGGPPSQRGSSSGGGTSSSQDGGGSFLGVPDDYEALAERRFRPNYQNPAYLQYSPNRPGAMSERVPVAPRYQQGDEWRPAGWRPDEIAALQRSLAQVGLIGPRTSVTLGVWDEASRTGYRDLLSFANGSGLDANSALARYTSGQTVTGGGGATDPETGEFMFTGEQFVAPEALPLQLPSREELQRVVRTTVIDRLGVGWSQGEIDQLVDQYIGVAQGRAQQVYDSEVGRQREAWESGVPSQDVNVQLDAPSVEQFTEDELIRRDPVGYQAAGVVNEAIPAFFSMMDGWGAPNS